MAELYTLPDGWEWKELGEVAKASYGYTEKASDEEIGPKFLRITDIQEQGVNWNTVPFCKIKDTDLGKYKLIEGDIVFARTGATTGKSYLIKNPPISVFASYLIRVHINYKELSSQFLYQYFQTNNYWNNINEGMSGSAQGGFNATKLSKLQIPIPPLEEQKRIVAKLDILFAKIDKAIALHQKNIDEANVFMASVLNDVFIELEEKHPVKSLNEVSFNIQYGYTDSAKDKGNAVFIRITDINENGKFKDNFVYINIDDKELNKFKLFKGDILVARSGATAGKVALFDLDLISVFASYLIRIQPNKEIDSSFLFYFCHSPKYWEQLNSIKVGGAQPNVNATNLKEIKIAIPPPKTQQKVVSYLDEISQKMEKIKQIQKEKMQSLKGLKASILDQAFKGEL